MAENTATDNQATKPTPSTPLPPTPDLGDGPWGMSTGTNNPNNQRDYTREPKGTINTNGGLLGVLGNVFDKLMELLARLFGNLIGKDTESIADKKADIEFNLENFAAAKKEYERGREKTNDHYAVNKSLNIPEYANKDIASEYLMFTHFGNAKIMLSNKDGKIDAVFEASIKENFMRCFSISIDQIKGHEGDKDLEKSVPFSVWMASPVYKRAFDASIDKDALLAGLSPEEKELLKQAKYKTKAERDGIFKDHPELEDKFTFVRNTALAVSNADIMANTITVESSITNTAIADFRFAPRDQMGAFQLTAQTALEFAGKTFDEKERISLGQKVLAELNISGKPKLSEAEVKNMVKHILGSDAYGGDGGNRTLFISSLTTYLNGCKNQKEFEAMVGSVAKIFGDENNYLQLQQNIMSAKMAWAINGVGGADRFNKIMQEGSTKEKGQLIVDMSNYYKDKFKDGAPFTAKELYNMFTGGKEAKSEDDALFELGKLAENDSKIIFAAVHTTYHGNPSKIETAKTFTGVDLFTGSSAIAAEKQAVEIAANSLTPVPKEGLNPDKEAQKYYLAKATDIADLYKSSLKNLLLDPAFKDYDLVKGASAKDMANMLEKAKISDEDRKNPVFQAFVKSLKEKPDMRIDGVPMEYITKMATDIRDSDGVKNDLKVDIEKLHKDVVAQRETYEKTLFSTITPAKAQKGDILLKELAANDLRKMVVEMQKAKDPNFAQLLTVLEKEKDIDISAYKNIKALQTTAVGEGYNGKNSFNVNAKMGAMREEQNKRYDEEERKIKEKEEEFIAENGHGRGWASREDENEADLLASQKEADTRRLDSFEKEVRAVDISLRELKAGDKDALNDPERLAQSIKLLTYGSKVVNSGGLDYQSLRDLTAQAMVNNKMFASVKDATDFLEQISMNQKDNPLNMNRGKFLEDRMETLFKTKEIPVQLASFIVEQKLLDKDSFKRSNPFDSMHQIFVTTTDGKRMNILDYGEEGKGYAHNDYLALYKEENNAQLANKTDNSNKGLDAEALAKVKEQADNKKEDVKVASMGI